MARMSIAAAILPARRFLRCAFDASPRADVPREALERVAIRRRSIARRIEPPDWCCMSLARIDADAAKESTARLRVTAIDGSESVVDVPYRSVDELLRDGPLRVDLPPLPPDAVAYVEIDASAPDGTPLVALPYQLRRKEDSSERGGGVRAQMRAGMVEAIGRTGQGPYPIPAGDYVAELAASVGAAADALSVQCRVGRTTKVTLAVLERVVPFRLRLVGSEAPYVGLLRFSVRDQRDARVAGYAGGTEGAEPQVWLPRGDYSLDVRVAGHARRLVPISIQQKGEHGMVEAQLDPAQ